MYQSIRAILFKLNAEQSHDFTIKILAMISKQTRLCDLFGHQFKSESFYSPTKVMGLKFPNRIGLAAGLDKHAQCINALSAMGFGFIETGTVTPAPQPGNKKPRMFRLPENQAIINRMGFNSVGLDQFTENFIKHKSHSIVGINLGKNAVTPLAEAVNDYKVGMQRTYTLADYLAINLSSPNTKKLRELQHGDNFEHLVITLKQEQKILSDQHGKYTPLAIKISPDLEDNAIEVIARTSLKYNIDAIIATNTTTQRQMIKSHRLSQQDGGLSGAPVRVISTQTIKTLANVLQGEIPIIGVGGIGNADEAIEKIQAGASLIQVYTGLIYKGPGLVSNIGLALKNITIDYPCVD